MKTFEELKEEINKSASDKWKGFSKVQLRALWLALRNLKDKDITQQRLFVELVKELNNSLDK